MGEKGLIWTVIVYHDYNTNPVKYEWVKRVILHTEKGIIGVVVFKVKGNNVDCGIDFDTPYGQITYMPTADLLEVITVALHVMKEIDNITVGDRFQVDLEVAEIKKLRRIKNIEKLLKGGDKSGKEKKR